MPLSVMHPQGDGLVEHTARHAGYKTKEQASDIYGQCVWPTIAVFRQSLATPHFS